MAKYQIKAPDGQAYEIDAPDDATPQQIEAMSREVVGVAKDYPVVHDAPPPPQPAPSFGQQLVDNTVNDVAGVVQGAAALPDMAAKAVGKVVSTIPTALGYGLDALGYGKAGTYMHATAHNLANPYQIGDAVEAVAPTPDTTSGKAGRFIGQLFGGAAAFPTSAVENVVSRFVGDAPKVASAAAKAVSPTIVDDANQAGVRVMTSDVKPPRTFIGKSAQAVGERIPITGTGGPREAQQAERIAAAKSVAQEYGAATGDELASPAIDAVATDLAAKRGARLTFLTKQKEGVINKVEGSVPVPNTIAAIDQQIEQLEKVGTAGAKTVIGKLKDWRAAAQGAAPYEEPTGLLDASGNSITRNVVPESKSLSTIEQIRKEMGEAFKDPSLAAVRGVGEKALSAIYGPIREDMGAFIKAKGNPGDFTKWKSANDELAEMVGDLKNTGLKRALNTADATPENVATLLFSQKPSDVRLLYDGLSDAGRAKAQAAILQRAVEKAGGMENLSPERFSTQLGSLGKSVGVFFQGKDLARVEGLARVLKATQRASQAALAPPTGVQAVPYAMGVGFTQLFGLGGGIAAAGATGLLARAYESAPVRNALLRLGQSKPGSAQEGILLKRATAAITAAVQRHSPSELSPAGILNDNLPQTGRLAASPDQRPDQQ